MAELTPDAGAHEVPVPAASPSAASPAPLAALLTTAATPTVNELHPSPLVAPQAVTLPFVFSPTLSPIPHPSSPQTPPVLVLPAPPPSHNLLHALPTPLDTPSSGSTLESEELPVEELPAKPIKRHPADLVSLSNPDPHYSPKDELDSPFERDRLSEMHASVEGPEVGAVSENGVTVGHGEVEDVVHSTGSQVVSEVVRAVEVPVVRTNGHGDKMRDMGGIAEIPAFKPPAVPAPNAKEGAKRSEGSRRETQGSGSTRSRRVLGEWTMGKTLGAGSMGKVKLAISGITGEKVAIKIIPRFTSTAAALRPPPESDKFKDEKQKVPDPDAMTKAAAKDASKEVRTMREASLCMLLHHPYVCGMKSMVLYPHHYYMVFEYVNGGQMLDYIISHGRLRERSARKFARQIGSALEYCHANSIVHRDLKIENILISKTGNIKIIDFGLSNLYSPISHLNTFCGSLYFAAPELLNAKPYTGPEVDVWSFGIVLYVLVCGKVPFDDQSMPALHAKIKRGQVEYPTWLSAECKHLLSRMLITNPATRATLTEVLNHPWMLKSFTGPPTSHLPPRVPLRLEEVDREVIKGMVGFEFGSLETIEAELVTVLSSDLYKGAVKAWDAKHQTIVMDGEEEKKGERPSTRVDGKDMKGGIGRSPTSKRFSGFGFYGKKIAGGFGAAFAMAGTNGKGTDDDGTANMLIGGLRPDSLDPTRGFHPLVSIYYLVKEKIEREKIWGPGVFASSTLSLTGPPPPPAPAHAYQSGTGLVSATAGEITKPVSALDADAAAQDQPTASPRLPMTPQPRQRATGDEYPSHPSTAPPPLRDDESRSNYAATKRSTFQQTPSNPTTPVMQQTFRPMPTYEPPASPSLRDRKSVHVMGSSGTERTVDMLSSEDTPLAAQSTFARRFGSLLGRSPPGPDGSSRGHRQRASIGGTAQKAGNKTTVSALPQVTETAALGSGGSDVPLSSPAEGKGVHRSSTVGELSPSRHQRGASMGTGTLVPATVGRTTGSAFFERRRQTSLGPNDMSGLPRKSTESPIDERGEEGAVREGRPGLQQQEVGFVGRTPSPSLAASDLAKPVWLKGLFSVSTTSTKPVATIRADLIKVLDRLGVQHRDVKSGFECAHVPSIDLSSVGASSQRKSEDKGGLSRSSSTKVTSTIKRRASKLLISAASPKELPPTSGDDSQTSLPPSEGRERTRTGSSTSFTVLAPPPPSGAAAPSMTPPHDAQFKSSTGEGSTVTSDLIVRFEIFIVSVQMLPGIHGLQFRRIGGNAWQYQMLAKRVLEELKL